MKRKFIGFIIGCLVLLLFLEISIRVSATLFSFYQEKQNSSHLENKDHKKIISIVITGESTSAVAANEQNTLLVQDSAYPVFLEKYLNQKNLPYHFEVTNKSIMGGETNIIYSELKKYLKMHRPNIIVNMMGMNDQFEDHEKNRPTIAFKRYLHLAMDRSSLYNYLNLLYDQLVKKYSGRDDTQTVSEFQDLSNSFLENNRRPVYLDIAFASSFKNLKLEDSKLREIVHQEYLAFYFIRTGQYQKALSLLTSVKKLHGFGTFLLVSYFLELNQLSNAEAVLKEYLKEHPQNPYALKELMMLYLNTNNLKAAQSLWSRSKSYPQRNELVLLNFQSQLEKQSHHYRKGIFLLENSCGIKKETRFDRSEEASMRELVQVLADEDIYRECTFFLSELYFLNKEYALAEKNLHYFVNTANFYFSGVNLLRKIYEINGENDKAKALFKQITTQNHVVGDYFALADYYKSHHHFNEMNNVYDIFKAKFSKTSKNFYQISHLANITGAKLIIMQYPTFSLEPLKKLTGKLDRVIYIDNEKIFDNAPREKYFFEPRYPYNFSHYTLLGAQVLAHHLADEIEKGLREGSL